MKHTRMQECEEVLKKASRCYQHLRLILEKEHEQLCRFDAEGLVSTTAEKNGILDQLKQTEGSLLEHKEELARLLGLPSEPIGLMELVGKPPIDSAGALKEIGEELIRRAQEVSRQLQRNRAMLEEGLAFVNDALACFQGVATSQSAAYSPSHEGRQRKPGPLCLRREV